MVKNGPARVDAVIIAGARNEGKLKDTSPEKWEALIEVGGKPLVQYSIDFLLAAKSIARIVMVGPKPELAGLLAGTDIEVIPPTGDMLENVLAGCRRLAELPGGRPGLVMVTPADLPLVTPGIVDGLVKVCLERGGDLFYPVASRETMESEFPGTKRTYGTLREGTFTGGNLFLVDAAVLERVAPQARSLIEGRKDSLKMARALGFSFVLRLLLGWLSVAALERHIQKTFGCVGRAIFVPWPEIGIDIDKPEDVELVEAYLAERGP